MVHEWFSPVGSTANGMCGCLSGAPEAWRVDRDKPEGRRARCAPFSDGTWMYLRKISDPHAHPRIARACRRGVLSFGYFSLHKQRKVTRASSAKRSLHLECLHLGPDGRQGAIVDIRSHNPERFALSRESLFFGWPKKSNQKKGHPGGAPFALRATGAQSAREFSEGTSMCPPKTARVQRAAPVGFDPSRLPRLRGPWQSTATAKANAKVLIDAA
jgi:hypothetical protein